MSKQTTNRLRGRLQGRFGRRGAALVEYGLLLLISVPIIAGITQGGVQLFNLYVNARSEIVKPTP